MKKGIQVLCLSIVMVVTMASCSGNQGDTESQLPSSEIEQETEVAGSESTETESEVCDSTESEMTETESAESESSEEEEIIVYQDPDIIKDPNQASDDSKWGHWIIENNELVFCEYENAVSCIVTLTHWEQEYEVPFRWAIHEGELVAKVDLPREMGGEEWFNAVPVDGSTDLIVIEIVGKQVGPTEAYLYSIEKGGLLPFIGEDVLGVAAYISGVDKYMVLPEYSQTLLIDSSSVLVYLHDEDRYLDISSLFGSNQSTKNMVRVDDQLLVYCRDKNEYKLSVYAYDPANYSTTKLIDGLSYETSQNTPHPARMTHWSGGISSGLLDGKFSYVNVFTNEIIPAKFDIYEYQWSLEIDGESILLIKENGHWDIVNKHTGKITHSSELALEIKSLGIPVVISEEGILYVRATNNQNQEVYYRLNYMVQS